MILLLAPPAAFGYVVPVLIAGASVALIIAPRLRALAPRPGAERSRWRLAAIFCVAVYVGYFGAAGGVLMLALLAATLTESLIRVNAIKNMLVSRRGKQPGGGAHLRPLRPRRLGVRAAAGGRLRRRQLPRPAPGPLASWPGCCEPSSPSRA